MLPFSWTSELHYMKLNNPAMRVSEGFFIVQRLGYPWKMCIFYLICNFGVVVLIFYANLKTACYGHISYMSATKFFILSHTVKIRDSFVFSMYLQIWVFYFYFLLFVCLKWRKFDVVNFARIEVSRNLALNKRAANHRPCPHLASAHTS